MANIQNGIFPIFDKISSMLCSIFIYFLHRISCNEIQPGAENEGCSPAHFEKKRPTGANMTLC
jgi:hypothetical protein